MVTIVIRKHSWWKFAASILNGTEEPVIRDLLPSAIGALILQNTEACKEGITVVWDDADADTRKWFEGKRTGYILDPLSGDSHINDC